jgi:endonuclease-3
VVRELAARPFYWQLIGFNFMIDITTKERIHKIVLLLEGPYGMPRQVANHSPVEVLVQTILSQNTSDRNSGSAFKTLMTHFKTYEALAEADVSTITRSIRSGGLGEIKAERIKQALNEICRRRGRLELDFLNSLTVSDAENWLVQLPGVGFKTARCVLLFALGMPALPVDTHIHRVSRRLGLIAPRAPLDEAHRILGETVAVEDVYPFHVLIIEHGRRVCRARNPDCERCVLREGCPRIGLGMAFTRNG